MKTKTLRIPFLRQRQLSLAEIENILDLLPQAALLLDMTEQRVILANGSAAQLTTFTRPDLSSLKPVDLLPELAGFPGDSEIRAGVCFEANLRTRSGSPLAVSASLHPLGPPAGWIIAVLEPMDVLRRKQEQHAREDSRLTELHDLASAVQADDLEQALDQILIAGQRLTGASFLAVYFVSSTGPELVKVSSMPAASPSQECVTAGAFAEAGGEDTQDEPEQKPEERQAGFPALLPLSDARSYSSPAVWVPGKRTENELQRSARINRFSYLASVPLGLPDALTGLVAAAHACEPANEGLVELLRILGDAIAVLIQHHTQVGNLSTELRDQSRALAIASLVRDSVQEGAILVDPDLTIRETNPAIEWILGYAGKEMAGQPIENVLIGAENLSPALLAARSGSPTPNLGDTRLHRRDGSAFAAHLSTLPAYHEDNLVGIVILVRDISEREQFQIRNQQLEQRAVLGEVTATFAHEVRNPLNNVLAGLRLLADTLGQDDSNQNLIARMEHDARRIEDQMRSVLDFARPMDYTFDEVDLSQLLERLLERWRPRLARVNVQSSIEVNTPTPRVNGNWRALEQVFSNLVGNAVEAMSANGGTLTVIIRSRKSPGDRDQVEVSIADTGPGIPEDIVGRIFEPYFTTGRNGTGLGLAICNRIVNGHKGTIHVESVPGGTVFQVVLPANSRVS